MSYAFSPKAKRTITERKNSIGSLSMRTNE